MNEKNLLIGLSYIDRKYIEESEWENPNRMLPKRKVWLIAAVVALMLFLMGCAAAVYARIHMKVVHHNVPTAAVLTDAGEESAVQTTVPVKDVLTCCYPQSLPAGYRLQEGAQLDHSSRNIRYSNHEGKTISFTISTTQPTDIALAPPMEKTELSIYGGEAVLQRSEKGGQALTWYNETEGYYGGLFTDDMAVDLAALAENVDYGEPQPLSFLCREGEIWDVWYPRQIPEGYVLRDVAPFTGGGQIIRYGSDGYGITYAVSLTRDFEAEATEPPHDPFTWEDLTVADRPARMMTTPGQRMLYWKNEQEGFYAMLIVADDNVDIVALAESVAPGEPLEVSPHYLGPDYTIELEQEDSYVGWESVYPQWVPEGYEMTFVSDPAYGQQTIRYENAAGEQLLYTFYFRLGEWGRQFDGMGQPEEVTIHGNPGYKLGSKLIWTDEAKGFGFELSGTHDMDMIAIAERVGIGPELEPTFADRTTKALEELGDYRIIQLPEGMVEDALTGLPLEDGGGWYSYIRRWYIDPNSNAQIYFEYETYVADPPIPVKTIVENYMGDRPVEFCTINDCTGAASQGDRDANVVWIAGNGKQGVRFKLISSDFSAQDLLIMAQSVQKK